MCGHCDFARNTGEFCVAGYGLFEVELSHTPEEICSIKAAIGRDLGRPCQHDNGMFEWVHVRYYGLITEQIIKPGGMGAIARGGWYDEYGRERLLQWGAKDPALAETYYRKVYVEGDRDYLLTFVKSLSER